MKEITINKNLNPASKYGRRVVLSPPYRCKSRRFKGLDGFNIQIGKSKFIDVPLSMLENIFNASLANNSIYDKNVFNILYPGLAERNGTPCYIHVVGQIFKVSGVVLPSGNGYWIKNF